MTTDTVSLMVGSYAEQRERAEELIQCLAANVANPLIGDVHVFIEDPVLQWENWFELKTEHQKSKHYPALDTLNALRAHPKVTVVPFGRRPYYSEYFEYANANFPEGRVTVVANSDVEFDETLSVLKGRNLKETFICLARDNGNSGHSPRLSQDSWIFQIPVKKGLISESGWPLGIGGGDHKIAFEARKAGYRLLNPCYSIKAMHRHGSRVRNWTMKPHIKGPGCGVDLTGIEAMDGPIC